MFYVRKAVPLDGRWVRLFGKWTGESGQLVQFVPSDDFRSDDPDMGGYWRTPDGALAAYEWDYWKDATPYDLRLIASTKRTGDF